MRPLLFVVLPAALLAQSDWPGYSRDATGQRYSPLAKINASNVARLKPVWQYALNPNAKPEPGANFVTEAVPIMVGGILYSPTRQRTIVALDPETGFRDLELCARQRRRAAPWRVLLAGRQGSSRVDPRGHGRWQADRDQREDRQAGPRFRQRRLRQFEGRRLRTLSRRAVSHGLARHYLSELNHHRRARKGRRAGRSRHGRTLLGSSHRETQLDVPHDSSSRRAWRWKRGPRIIG